MNRETSKQRRDNAQRVRQIIKIGQTRKWWIQKETEKALADNTLRGKDKYDGKYTPKDSSREEIFSKERMECYNVDMLRLTQTLVTRREHNSEDEDTEEAGEKPTIRMNAGDMEVDILDDATFSEISCSTSRSLKWNPE